MALEPPSAALGQERAAEEEDREEREDADDRPQGTGDHLADLTHRPGHAVGARRRGLARSGDPEMLASGGPCRGAPPGRSGCAASAAATAGRQGETAAAVAVAAVAAAIAAVAAAIAAGIRAAVTGPVRAVGGTPRWADRAAQVVHGVRGVADRAVDRVDGVVDRVLNAARHGVLNRRGKALDRVRHGRRGQVDRPDGQRNRREREQREHARDKRESPPSLRNAWHA